VDLTTPTLISYQHPQLQLLDEMAATPGTSSCENCYFHLVLFVRVHSENICEYDKFKHISQKKVF